MISEQFNTVMVKKQSHRRVDVSGFFNRFFNLGSHRPCWDRYFLLLCVCKILTQRTSHLNRQDVEGAQGAKGMQQNSGKASYKLQAVDKPSYQLSRQLLYTALFILFSY